MRNSALVRSCLIISVVLFSALSLAQSQNETVGAGTLVPDRLASPKKPYSPYAGRSFPTRVFFGETHLHTAYSMDAGAFGARLTPRDAYRFARGEEVMSNTGQPVKLSRPLDFAVVTDHSDNMGFFPDLFAGKPNVLADPTGKKWYNMIQSGQGNAAALEIIVAFSHGKFPEDIMYFPGTTAYQNAWHDTIAAAEEYNEPGLFTAFIGYEWTSNTGGNNLHRNVIYRDDGDKAGQLEPYTVYPPYGSDNPVDLWKWMAFYEDKTGGKVLAMAHNGNLSNGQMFPDREAFGKRLDRDYVTTRARWERLYEATQTKGDGEAHPILSPDDAFADFETWDKGNLDGSVPKTDAMLPGEYVRSGLKRGLLLEQRFGVNPYAFGLGSGSDAHTALVAMAEENFFGKTAPQEPSPERITAVFVDNPQTGVKIMDWEVGASGYTGVWATENTRKALWDAMERKETYSTTGPRMIVRFFGGWDFVAADANSRLPANAGYAKGVPMGGRLKQPPDGASATFLVAAVKDPYGGNLDRVQIIKGWLDSRGDLHEKVYDVVWSGERRPGPDGTVPLVGSTVDVANATWTNTIGASELIAVWKDPDFDPDERAFYYARVIEIPTPRWTAYDAKRFGVTPAPGTRMIVTERAYTSPIWYSPEG